MSNAVKWSLEGPGAPVEPGQILSRIPRLLRFELAGREDRLLVRLARRLGYAEAASLELSATQREIRLRAYRGSSPARWLRHLSLERAGLVGLAAHPVARCLDGDVEPAAARLIQALRLHRLTALPLGCHHDGWRLLLLADGPRMGPEALAGLRDAARAVVDAARSQSERRPPKERGRSGNAVPEDAVQRARRLVDRQQELLANLSHDFKNPLAAISTSLQVLLGERAGTTNATQRRLLGLARRNCDRLLQMVNELVDGGRKAEMETILSREDLDASRLLQEVMADTTEQAAAHRRNLAWVCDHGARVWGDPQQIRRILDNLVENSLKFCGQGGNVLVTLRRDRPRNHDEVGKAASSLGLAVHGLEILVEDDGPGFSEEARKKAFERYWQGEGERERGRGWGLGLSIVHSLVHAHQGHVELSSEPGRGTTVRVWLPAEAEDARRCGVLHTLLRAMQRRRARGKQPHLILIEATAAEDEYLAGLSRLCEDLAEPEGRKWSVHRIHPVTAVVLADEEIPEEISRRLARQERSARPAESSGEGGASPALRLGEARFGENGETLDELLRHARRSFRGGAAAAAHGAELPEVRS